MEQPVPTHLPEAEQIEQIHRWAYLAECNQAMAEMYGYASPNEILGVPMRVLLPQSDSHNVEQLRAFIRSGYRLTDAESHELDRNGQPRIFLNNALGIVENGALLRVWGMQRDVTERRQLELDALYLAALYRA
jgi:PAS domain S-box-containing protein